jgi:calcineurin-like phosphoesterase family protein
MSVYAVSDIHGMYNLYEQIKDFIKPEDTVFCLGDMGDRGPDGWKTVKTILSDPQFKVIKGNHEDMLIQTMKEYYSFPIDERYRIIQSGEMSLLRWNGGEYTFKNWMKEKEGTRIKFYRRLMNLPTHLEYMNKHGRLIFMSHAGFTPFTPDNFPTDEELVWDRRHYTSEWPEDALENAIAVHGHTPIFYLVEDLTNALKEKYDCPPLPTAYWYADNHKCCIDNGSFVTNCIVLLDLDTFEEHKFYTDDYDSTKEF